jgi:hypothetical protein
MFYNYLTGFSKVNEVGYMTKQNFDFDDRIFKFYQYLEHRLEMENAIETQLLTDKTSKPHIIKYKRKKQPILSSI